MNLYDRLYTAIEKGLYESFDMLQIENNDNDNKVNYQRGNIKNNLNIIDILVHDLFTNIDDIQNIYNQIIEHYNASNNRYNVSDMFELNNLYNIIKDLNNFSLDWIDCTNVVSLVKDDNEIPLYEYYNGLNPDYLKFYTNTEPIFMPLHKGLKSEILTQGQSSFLLAFKDILNYLLNTYIKKED